MEAVSGTPVGWVWHGTADLEKSFILVRVPAAVARSEDPLSAVANPTNRRVLCLLASQAAHPRRIAALLDLPETEVSRRLRALERAGFVRGQWERDGANVRKYRLVADKVVLSFANDGLHVTVEHGAEARSGVIRVHDFHVPEVPSVIADPAPLLQTLGRRRGVILVGLPGSGVSTRAAAAARLWRGPAFWANLREEVSRGELESNLQVFLAEQGRQPDEPIAEGLDRAQALVVLDDFHRAEPGVGEFIRELLQRRGDARLLLTMAEEPGYAPPGQVEVVRITGFGSEDGLRFLDFKGLGLPREQGLQLIARVAGHPLSLNFYAEALLSGTLSFQETVDDIPEEELRERIVDTAFKALPEREQKLLEAASIFRAPFTSDDLEAVTDESRVRYGLLKLEKRLLVQRAEDRYRIHEVLVPYLAKLVSRPKILHERAAKHFEALQTVEGRILAVHHWVAAGNIKSAARVLASDVPLDTIRRLAPVHGGLYAQALRKLLDEPVGDRALISAKDDLGDLAMREGRLDEAKRRFEEVLELAERSKDHERADEARRKLRMIEGDEEDAAPAAQAKGAKVVKPRGAKARVPR